MPCGFDAENDDEPRNEEGFRTTPPRSSRYQAPKPEPPDPPDPNVNLRMIEDEAWGVCIDFQMTFGLNLKPVKTGAGYSAMVPMEILKRYLPAPVEPAHRTWLKGPQAPAA